MKNLPLIGLIPAGLLAYGLYSGRRGFIWVGGVWLAWSVYYQLANPKAATQFTTAPPGSSIAAPPPGGLAPPPGSAHG